MAEDKKQDIINQWLGIGKDLLLYVLKKWYFLILAGALGAAFGYFRIRNVQPTYTATYTFVLSTDQRGGNSGLAGLASQLGVDGLTSGPDNIFSGDNIIELFKSRKLVGNALLAVVDTITHQTLLNYIAQRRFARMYKRLGAFGNYPDKYNATQTGVYRMIIGKVSSSFMVFKKDKKLIFYVISATDTDPNVAYYIAKTMLDQTAQYFIDTKTRVSASSVYLLQREADSLANVLSHNFSSTASMTDRTYNLNPSVTIQRSGLMFNQAKANALAGAYTEVMRNLEVAKINLQKETPLYRIIDEPELPLMGAGVNKSRYITYTAIAGLLIMLGCLVIMRYYKQILAKLK